MKGRPVTEFDLQRAYCLWLDGHSRQPPALCPNVVYFAVPNGGARSPIEGKRFKETGVKPGIHDLLFLAQGGLFGMEWKKPGGTLSDAQKAMHPRLMAAGMAASIVVDNLDEAKDWSCRFMLTFRI